MNMPTRMVPLFRGLRVAPGWNSPTSLVKPPAKANRLGNGKYSPEGTGCTLSSRAVPSPVGLIHAAELYTSGGPGASVVPMEPAIVQIFVLRAIALMASRNRESLVKNGAGDSGQTTNSIFVGLAATDFTVSSVSSFKVC